MCFGGMSPDVFGPPIDLAPPGVQVEQFFTNTFGNLGDFAGGALQGAGVGWSAASAYQAEEGRKKAYKYSARIAAENARMEEWLAKDAMRRGDQTKFAIGLKTGALKGTQRASLAARGLDIGEGSPLDLLTSTEYMGQVDLNTATDNTNKEVFGHRARARSYTNESQFYEEAADNADPFAAAAGTLMGGVGKVASSWYRLNKVS